MSCDVPPVYRSGTQIDVRDKRPVFAFGSIKQLDGTLARRSYDGFESSVAEAFPNDVLNILVVFDDQDKQLAYYLVTPGTPPSQQRRYTRSRDHCSAESAQKCT